MPDHVRYMLRPPEGWVVNGMDGIRTEQKGV